VGGKRAAMLFPQDAVERSMKVRDVIVRAIAGQLSWLEAVEILGLSPRKLFSPLCAGRWFLVRAGLSRRQLGWRGDLCAVVPAASGTGVPALPAGRAAPRGVPARVPGALRQAARPPPPRRLARAARVPHTWPGVLHRDRGRGFNVLSILAGHSQK